LNWVVLIILIGGSTEADVEVEETLSNPFDEGDKLAGYLISQRQVDKEEQLESEEEDGNWEPDDEVDEEDSGRSEVDEVDMEETLNSPKLNKGSKVPVVPVPKKARKYFKFGRRIRTEDGKFKCRHCDQSKYLKNDFFVSKVLEAP